MDNDNGVETMSWLRGCIEEGCCIVFLKLFVFVYGLKGDVVYVLSNVLFMFIG